jgi:hypothetical protein
MHRDQPRRISRWVNMDALGLAAGEEVERRWVLFRSYRRVGRHHSRFRFRWCTSLCSIRRHGRNHMQLRHSAQVHLQIR